MTWMSYLKSDAPVEVVDALGEACLRCDDWKPIPKDRSSPCARALDAYLAADYTGRAFRGEGLGLVAQVWPDEPDRVLVSMYADRWENEADSPSDEEYAHAEDLALPLLQNAGKIVGKRLRLVRPAPDGFQPLRGALAEAMRGVTGAYQIWADPQRKVRGLHPSERERFWRFIRAAHQFQSVLRPRDVAHHLAAAGFHPDLVRELSRDYEVGRQVLTVYAEPWNLRQVHKERRRKQRAEFEQEFPLLAAKRALQRSSRASKEGK